MMRYRHGCAEDHESAGRGGRQEGNEPRGGGGKAFTAVKAEEGGPDMAGYGQGAGRYRYPPVTPAEVGGGLDVEEVFGHHGRGEPFKEVHGESDNSRPFPQGAVDVGGAGVPGAVLADVYPLYPAYDVPGGDAAQQVACQKKQADIGVGHCLDYIKKRGKI